MNACDHSGPLSRVGGSGWYRYEKPGEYSFPTPERGLIDTVLKREKEDLFTVEKVKIEVGLMTMYLLKTYVKPS